MSALAHIRAGGTSLAAELAGSLAQLASRLDFHRLLDQHGRLLKVETALPQLALIPERMVMKERLGQPFKLTLDCLSTSVAFELKRLIGEQVSLRLLQADGSYKPWHGYVLEAAQLGADGGVARYRLVTGPWLCFLALRRDSFVFQDKTALEIVEDVFRDHPSAHWRVEVTEPLRRRSLCVQYRESDLEFVQRLLAEEGLSYHFEHLDGEAAQEADAKAHAKHVLVITDRAAQRIDLGSVRFTRQHPTAHVDEQRDAIDAFACERRVVPNAVTLGSWDYRRLVGITAQAHGAQAPDELPTLEHYDGSGAYRYENRSHAQRAAELALAALELQAELFEGQGGARQFEAGRRFRLIDHPLYGANTTAFNYAGALLAADAPADNAFTLLAVEHHATNNLGAQAAELLALTDLEHGTYRNHFHAAPAAAPVVPRFVRKPTAHGLQTAVVVGMADEALTTDRDHRVKIQFPWQRGERPLAGGLAHDPSAAQAQGNATADERSGTWVRVALPSAGANHGAVFVPRIGTEVAVEFIEADIDRPVIVGQLYNGQDAPPFAAGVDSGVNHAGVISGLHTSSLDHSGFNQWTVDDATGQLRMRLLCSYLASEIGLGHLIQQGSQGAQRGSWRGSGFELNTRGWGSLRAERGLFVSTSARAGSYGSAQSTQMDAREALDQLESARHLGQRLSEVARAGTAHPLTSHDDGQALDTFMDTIDPAKNGKHQASVSGQPARKAQGRTLTDPVEAFATPVVLMDTPSTVLMTSEASIAHYAGQDLSLAVQGDVQHTAAHTYAGVSGQTTSVYTHGGGIKTVAAHGPVSLRAHTEEFQLLADQEVTVISVNDEIRIEANQKIELIAGQTSIVLEGGNVTFACPGLFQVKGGGHAFLGGASAAALMPDLPTDLAKLAPDDMLLEYKHDDGEPVQGAPYEVTFADGSKRTGVLNAAGRAVLNGVPKGYAAVKYGEDARKAPTGEPPANRLFGML